LLKQADRFEGQSVGLVLCGGNLDTAVLARVLRRWFKALIRCHHLFKRNTAAESILSKLNASSRHNLRRQEFISVLTRIDFVIGNTWYAD
jgi:hypothetical protein